MRGLGGIIDNFDEGRKILVNFKKFSPYDLLLVQEHKLSKGDIHFVDAKLGASKSIWMPAQPEEQGRGGLAIRVRERYADKVTGSGVDKKREFIWINLATLCDMWLGVGDPWLLNPSARAHGSLDFSWCNKREEGKVLSRIDRAYLPLDWIGRVRSMEIMGGSFESDHYPFILELSLGSNVAGEQSKRNMSFFRLNWAVVTSAARTAGVKDILGKWCKGMEEYSPLKKLELALEEVKRFLWALGKEMAAERRGREVELRLELQRLWLLVPDTEDANLSGLMVDIAAVQAKIDVIETHTVRGHKIRAEPSGK